MIRRSLFAAVLLTTLAATAFAQQWSDPVRGAWVRDGTAHAGDVTLATPAGACEIAVAPSEHSAVQQAAAFLAGDIEKITGHRPAIVPAPTEGAMAIILATAAPGDPFAALWEAYRIQTEPQRVRLTGSNFRGTAFAAYTLAERLGIDPLYHWTGYVPERRTTLVLKETRFQSGPPTFKYRGLFHDDEDILPRPIDPGTGYPHVRGTVPDVWYERFFETALRLRMNQVAPFTRAFRPFHIQKLASDWGLFYSSHHYDILLSNPYGFTNFNLARQRGVTGGYDYINNKAMVERYWRAGVEENKNLDAIYPVGLRATDDYGYNFPPGTTLEQKARMYEQVIGDQVRMAKEILPPDKTPLFHLTLYNEMMDIYRLGGFDLPEDVMLIWDDNGDGVMRALPPSLGKWKHGVYYHLAFFGATSKQSVHTVTPMRIAQEFRKIVNAGATEYMLLNVSELREHVMETRMIAEICWDAPTALAGADPAARYIGWWAREYFGEDAAPLAEDAYRRYYALNSAHSSIWYGSDRVRDILNALTARLSGRAFSPPSNAVRNALARRAGEHAEAQEVIARAAERMTPDQQRFFFEHVSLGLLIDYRPVQAALALLPALAAPDYDSAWKGVESALPPLQQMEEEIRQAERPPFEDWYRATWIRVADPANSWSSMNVHRPYDMLTDLLRGPGEAGYTASRPFPPVGNGSGEISGDLRGIAVNSNPGSPYYGWVYIGDRTGQTNRVRIYRPNPERHRNAATAYEDTGLSITVSSSTSQFSGGVYAPMGLSIGADDTVWIADFSERQIEYAPPAPPSGNAVASRVAVRLADFDAQARANLPAGWTPGHPRNVAVRGPRDRAVVLVANNTSDTSATDNTVQKFHVDATRDSVSHIYTHAIMPFPGANAAQGTTGHSATLDHNGNAYIPLRTAGGEIAVAKLDPSGVRVPFPALAPADAPDAAFPGIAYVQDPTAEGGGYLYWSGRVSDSTRQIVYRFDLTGRLLDGFGGFFGTDILSGNVLGYMAADDTGALYPRLGNGSANANFMKIVRTPARVQTDGPVRSSPAVAEGLAFFGSDDGRLYAVDTITGQPPPSTAFPVDVAEGRPGLAVAGRLAIRPAGGAMRAFFTTTDGRVGRVDADGRDLRLSTPLTRPTEPVDTTPAVDDDILYAAMSAADGAAIFAVDANTLDVAVKTHLSGAQSVHSSPARYAGSLYVGTDAGVFRLTGRPGEAQTVQSVFAEATLGPPFIHHGAGGGPRLYAAGAGGRVYARNAITAAPAPTFGGGLVTLAGAAEITSGPYALDGVVYVGDAEGRVYALREADGAGGGPSGSPVFFDTGLNALAGGGISKGISAAPASDGGWNIVFGSRSGLYYQVRATDPAKYRVTALTNGISRPFNTVAGVDTRASAEFIGNDDGCVYRIPRF